MAFSCWNAHRSMSWAGTKWETGQMTGAGGGHTNSAPALQLTIDTYTYIETFHDEDKPHLPQVTIIHSCNTT